MQVIYYTLRMQPADINRTSGRGSHTIAKDVRLASSVARRDRETVATKASFLRCTDLAPTSVDFSASR